MKLILEFMESYYTVRRTGPKEFEVTKFTGGKAPDYTYKVKKHSGGMYFTESPGFSKTGQKEKTIRLVKQFEADGEPRLAHYKFDAKNEPVLHKFTPPEEKTNEAQAQPAIALGPDVAVLLSLGGVYPTTARRGPRGR